MAVKKDMPKPAILCLHGRGTSGAIFEIQAMPLLRILESQFEFVFVDAPIESEPGPGVLPVFEDEGPYFSWLADAPEGSSERSRLTASIQLLDKLELSHCSIVGVLGFSQGAAIGMGLLLREQRRQEMKLSTVGYGFGIFIGGGTLPLLLEEASNNSFADVSAANNDLVCWPQILQFPTLHAAGSRDKFASRDIGLKNWIQSHQNAVSISFEGGHEMPNKEGDVLRLATEILKMYQQS
jgi:predicted esterase